MKIEFKENPTVHDIEFISESLFEYNCEKVGINDYKSIVFLLKSDMDEVCGGIIGWSRWGWAHIDNLWIKETHRGNGFGIKLLNMFELVAEERGCKMIDLDTFNFQAPEFYLKNGYKQLFVLTGIANNTTKHFFNKVLSD